MVFGDWRPSNDADTNIPNMLSDARIRQIKTVLNIAAKEAQKANWDKLDKLKTKAVISRSEKYFRQTRQVRKDLIKSFKLTNADCAVKNPEDWLSGWNTLPQQERQEHFKLMVCFSSLPLFSLLLSLFFPF
jgi:hypothetical protein